MGHHACSLGMRWRKGFKRGRRKQLFSSSPPYLAHWLAANGGSNTGKEAPTFFSLAAKETRNLHPPVAETRLCSPRLLASGGTDNLSSPVRHFSFVAITFADLRYAAILRLYPTPLLLNDELFDELLISSSKQKKMQLFFFERERILQTAVITLCFFSEDRLVRAADLPWIWPKRKLWYGPNSRNEQ